MAELMKVAVIGVGSMGANHVRVFGNLDGVDLVGVCDANEANLAKVARRHRINAYSDVSTLLNEAKPDAVAIAVPTTLHKSVASMAIEAGAHVLLEKPIAPTIEEGREIVALAKKYNVQLMIGHIERYNPAIQLLQQKLQEDVIGELYRVEVDRAGPFPARIFDVGVTLDLAVHDLDIISSLLNARPTNVYGHSQQLLHQNHEDAILGLIDYPGDILAILNINWTTPVKKREIRVYGRKGMMSVDYLTQELRLFENPAQSSVENGWGPLGITEGNTIKFNLFKQEPLAREVSFFINAVREGKDLTASVEDSLSALRISQLLVESSQSRQVIQP